MATEEKQNLEVIQKLVTALYNRLLIRFSSDPLFLYELEAECRTRAPVSDRFLFFFQIIPLMIYGQEEQYSKLYQNKRILEEGIKLLHSRVVRPIKHVMIHPGRVSIKYFSRQSRLTGLDFINITAQLEQEGYIAVDMKSDSVHFIQKKIEHQNDFFSGYLPFLLKQFEGHETMLFNIQKMYQDSIRIPTSNPLYKVYDKVIDNRQRVGIWDFKLKGELTADNISQVLYESMLFINIFSRDTRAMDSRERQELTQYIDYLGEQCIALAKDEQILSKNKRQMFMLLACLSQLPGKSIKLVNEFFRGKNALEFDNIHSKFEQVYA